MISAWPVALFAAPVAATAYLACAAGALLAFARRPCEFASEFLPSVSVLKPLAGLEPNLFENLASFCDQDYPGRFEVVFCLHDRGDPAGSVAASVCAAFPAVTTAILYGHRDGRLNPKIANLLKADERDAEIVVVADSDIRVGRDYLRAIASGFASAQTGAVTCLYRGTPGPSLVSRLGALGIDDGFAPSVLVALLLGKMRFCLGATMAVRASALRDAGGLAALGATIADDHELGRLVAAQGRNVSLSRYVVATTVPETRLRDLWAHELRWARTNFELARAGYLFSFLMYAVPLALISLAVSRNLVTGVPLVAAALVLRYAVHALSRRALGVRTHDDSWLVPVRDFMSLGIWAVSLFGRRRAFR